MASIPAAPFFFAFNGCDAFVFQPEDSVAPVGQEDTEYYRTLKITFPDGNVLLFDEANDTFPDADEFTTTGQLGNLESQILADLHEWGLVNGQEYVNVDIDQLKIDVGLYPDMFKDSDGDPVAFSYDQFPSGVYKVYYKVVFKETGGGGNTQTDGITDGGGVTTVGWNQSTKYYKSTCALDSCFLTKVDTYFSTRCDEDTNPCHEYKKKRDMLKDIVILKHGAEIDFAAERYTEANEKLVGASNLCSTGICTYKHGC